MSATTVFKFSMNNIDDYYIEQYKKYVNFKYYGVGSNVNIKKLYILSMFDNMMSNPNVCENITIKNITNIIKCTNGM